MADSRQERQPASGTRLVIFKDDSRAVSPPSGYREITRSDSIPRSIFPRGYAWTPQEKRGFWKRLLRLR